MPRSLAQAARAFYEQAVREQVFNDYRASVEGEEHPNELLGEYRLQWTRRRENEPGLPDEVYAAHLFYVQHFTDEDIGSDRVIRFPVNGKDVFAVRTTTDGDDTWVELYDAKGKFLAAARTHLDIVAWGTRDWLRNQVAQTAEYPPELRGAMDRSLWGQPIEGLHCAVRHRECTGSPHGSCIEPVGHLQADHSPHRCSRCGFTWGGQPRPTPARPPPEPEVVTWIVKIYFHERGSGFVYTLKDTPLTLATPEGQRRIPVEDIRQIDFGRRDPATGALKGRKLDVVQTAKAKLTGTLEGDCLRTHNPATVSQQLRFADMKKLLPLTKQEIRKAFTFGAPDPLVSEGGAFGQKRRYKVVGSIEGQVFGTDLYTLNSSIAAAAVHAGRVRPGKKGVVEVEIVPSPSRFKGSTRKDVTSASANELPLGAYRFLEPEDD
jgi:hypothetical protein